MFICCSYRVTVVGWWVYVHHTASVCAQSLGLVPLFCKPMDNPPGSTVHGIFQAGILEWAAISSSNCFRNPDSWDSHNLELWQSLQREKELRRVSNLQFYASALSASIHLSSQLTCGSNPTAPPSEKEARELNTTMCPEISGKPHVRWDCYFLIWCSFNITWFKVKLAAHISLVIG